MTSSPWLISPSFPHLLIAEMRLSALVPLLLPFSIADDWGPYGEVCLADQPSLYDPLLFTSVPWFTIDLDLPPRLRWEWVAQSYGDKMKAALKVVKGMIEGVGGDGAWEMVTILMTDSIDRINEPFLEEIKAIAEVADMSVTELTLMNLFYEIAKACTSIVAQDKDGNMIHGRNQDFGTFFFWNPKTRTWDLTTALKDLVINMQFVRGGKMVFKGVSFAGHMGILTGLKPNAFTVTVNSRFGSAETGLFNFLLHGLHDMNFLVFAIRDMLTHHDTFEDATAFMENVPLIAPGYLIMSGSKPGQGVVITRATNGSDHVDSVDVSKPNGWYVLETNYDWNSPELFLDVRREPGNDCMRRVGQNRIGLQGLYQVLSGKPNLNKATVYTAVMDVNKGILQSVIRTCDDPCWFV